MIKDLGKDFHEVCKCGRCNHYVFFDRSAIHQLIDLNENRLYRVVRCPNCGEYIRIDRVEV